MLFKMKCNIYYFFEKLLFNVAILYIWCPHYAKFLDPSLPAMVTEAATKVNTSILKLVSEWGGEYASRDRVMLI
jgi:hypothetical protein